MIEQIRSPNVDALFDDLAQFAALENCVGFIAGGCLSGAITGAAAAALRAGSRFEMNGLLYAARKDVSIGTLPNDGAVRYAVCSSATLALSLTSTRPQFDAAKGGFYVGADRALAACRRQAGIAKHRLLKEPADIDADFNAVKGEGSSAPEALLNRTAAGKYEFTLPRPGVYRITLRAGGGAAGSGGGVWAYGSNGGPGGGIANFFDCGAGSPGVAGEAPGGATMGRGGKGGPGASAVITVRVSSATKIWMYIGKGGAGADGGGKGGPGGDSSIAVPFSAVAAVSISPTGGGAGGVGDTAVGVAGKAGSGGSCLIELVE